MGADGVYLISGIQGAGKTSVSRLLASRFARAAHIEADVLAEMIVSGLEWWSADDPEGEGARQLRLRARNASLLADSFVEAGFTPVIDDIAVGERLAYFRSEIRSRPLCLVVLAPRVDVANRRYREAPFREPPEVINALLDRAMRRENAGVGLWLDTSEQTPEETVEEILRRAPAEAAV